MWCIFFTSKKQHLFLRVDGSSPAHPSRLIIKALLDDAGFFIASSCL